MLCMSVIADIAGRGDKADGNGKVGDLHAC
jgi:hypothetical protein